MERQGNVERTRLGALDLIAQAVAAPCLACAFLLNSVVTWAPSAMPTRCVVSVALVVVSVGAGVINLRPASPCWRRVGAFVMTMGVVALVGTSLW